jgi:mannose/fructose/N-acetylgalactosamine-specific phosphotransferase system component IIB
MSDIQLKDNEQMIFAITKEQIETVAALLVKQPYADVSAVIEGLKRLPQIKIQESNDGEENK